MSTRVRPTLWLLLCAASPLALWAQTPATLPSPATLPDAELRAKLLVAEQAAPAEVQPLLAAIRGQALPERVAAILKLRALGPAGAGGTLALSELLWGEVAGTLVLQHSVRAVTLDEVAAYGLGGLGEVALAPLVLATVSDRETAREAAGRVLKSLYPNWAQTTAARAEVPALLVALDAKALDIRRAASRTLGALADPRALDPLSRLLATADTPLDLRLTAVRSLARIADASVPERLSAGLKDESHVVRTAVAEALGELEPLPTDRLLAILADKHPSPRAAALSALRRAKGAPVALAVAALLKDSDRGVREQAAITLGELRQPAGVDPLIGALTDSSRNVKEEAAYALGRLGEKRSVPALLQLAQDEDARLREVAARALARLGDLRAVDILIVQLGDDNKDVRELAALALHRLTKQELGADQAKWREWWRGQQKGGG